MIWGADKKTTSPSVTCAAWASLTCSTLSHSTAAIKGEKGERGESGFPGIPGRLESNSTRVSRSSVSCQSISPSQKSTLDKIFKMIMNNCVSTLVVFCQLFVAVGPTCFGSYLVIIYTSSYSLFFTCRNGLRFRHICLQGMFLTTVYTTTRIYPQFANVLKDKLRLLGKTM